LSHCVAALGNPKNKNRKCIAVAVLAQFKSPRTDSAELAVQ